MGLPGFGDIQNFGAPTPQKDQRVVLSLQNTAGNAPSLGTTVIFDINPEQLQIELPSRVTTTLTIAGAYQDNWGPGVGRLTLSGTTGWRKKTADGRDGFTFYQALYQLHTEYQRLCATQDPDTVVLTIILPPGPGLAALTQNLAQAQQGQLGSQFGYYRVSSDNFTTQRNKQEPLLFRYQWDMTVLEDRLQGTPPDPSPRFVLVPGATAADPLANRPGGSTLVGGTPAQAGNPLTAAKAATAADPYTPSAHPTAVTLPANEPLATLAAANGTTAQEIQLYAQTNNLPIPDLSASVPQQITLPDANWINSYRQQLAKLSAGP
jgi:hypothetical protein